MRSSCNVNRWVSRGAATFLFVLFVSVSVAGGTQSLSERDTPGFKKQVEAPAQAARSPFAPAKPSEEDVTMTDLVLSGVAIGRDSAHALISGYIVQVGDKIAGHRVTSIGTNKVILQKLDQVVTLQLGGGM